MRVQVVGGCCSGASRVRVRVVASKPAASAAAPRSWYRAHACRCQTKGANGLGVSNQSVCRFCGAPLVSRRPSLARARQQTGPAHARRRPVVALLNLRTAPIVEAVATVLPVRELRSDCLRTQQGHAESGLGARTGRGGGRGGFGLVGRTTVPPAARRTRLSVPVAPPAPRSRRRLPPPPPAPPTHAAPARAPGVASKASSGAAGRAALLARRGSGLLRAGRGAWLRGWRPLGVGGGITFLRLKMYSTITCLSYSMPLAVTTGLTHACRERLHASISFMASPSRVRCIVPQP